MAFDEAEWLMGTTIYVPKETPRDFLALFMSDTSSPHATDVWHLADLSDIIPVGSKAVHLSGLLLISHGQNPEIADLNLWMRRYGSSKETSKSFQVIEASESNGQRCTMAAWVPVEDQKFEWKWTRRNPGTKPEWSNYGINLRVNAILI